MAKRRHKIEPISVDEITASPSLEGYDAFLRFRPTSETPPGESPMGIPPVGDFPSPASPGRLPEGELPVGKLSSHIGEEPGSPRPIGVSGIGVSPIGVLSMGSLPIGELHGLAAPVGFALAGRRQKVHRALSIRDGHSHGEQQLYEVLWTHGAFDSPETRVITIGYGGMQDLCRLDKTNCKKNILSLIDKLAIEIAGPYDIRRNLGNTYRVYSPAAVLRRRQQAGLEFVIRTSGVRFVSRP